MLDLESEVMRGQGSIPTGGNILSLDFVSRSKASDAYIGIIAILMHFERKPILIGHLFSRILCTMNTSVGVEGHSQCQLVWIHNI